MQPPTGTTSAFMHRLPHRRPQRFELRMIDAVVTDYKNNKRRSLDKVKRMLKKYIRPVFVKRRAITVKRTDLDNYVSRRTEMGAAPATINRELAVIKRAFSLGVRKALIGKAPDLKGLLLEENNVREGFFELDEFLKLYAYLPDYLKPMAEMGYTYGMRKGELLSLRCDQVDRVACTITLSQGQTKNKRGRFVSYRQNAGIRDLIERQFQRKAEIERKRDVKIKTLFFRFSSGSSGENSRLLGRPIKDFHGVWRTACAASEVKRTFHDLRRTAVRNMVRAGIPEKVAMTISGHRTRIVFERYNIVDANDLELAGGKIGLGPQLSSAKSSTQPSSGGSETTVGTDAGIDFPTTKQ